MSENNKFVSWVKAHKTESIIAGVSVTAIIGIILGLKNKDAIKELWDALENSLSKTPDKIYEPVTIQLNRCLRKLRQFACILLHRSRLTLVNISGIYLVEDIIPTKKLRRLRLWA